MRVTSSRVGYANPWLSVREDSITYADGSETMFGVVLKNDFATVIPVEDDGFWLVRQWRHAVQQLSWEFPAGGYPPGFAGDASDAETLARLELREETGITAGRLEHLGRLAPNIGLVEQHSNIWLATELTHGEPDREASEEGMEHAFFTRAQFLDLVRDGEFVDAQSLAAYALLVVHELHG